MSQPRHGGANSAAAFARSARMLRRAMRCSYSAARLAGKIRWVCESTKPGSTTRPPRSSFSAPAGWREGVRLAAPAADSGDAIVVDQERAVADDAEIAQALVRGAARARVASGVRSSRDEPIRHGDKLILAFRSAERQFRKFPIRGAGARFSCHGVSEPRLVAASSASSIMGIFTPAWRANAMASG